MSKINFVFGLYTKSRLYFLEDLRRDLITAVPLHFDHQSGISLPVKFKQALTCLLEFG